MSDLTSGAPKEEPPTGINDQAPLVGASEIEIAADAEAVWEVLTAFERRPSWNREVKSMTMQGDVAPGLVFRWKAGPGTITSTIQRVERPRLIAWTGKTLGIKAIHFWHVELRNGSTSRMSTSWAHDDVLPLQDVVVNGRILARVEPKPSCTEGP
jgi:hypothetical protein